MTPSEAEELVSRFGSPLYVYDAERIRDAYRRFAAAFSYRPLSIHYAIVCNKNRYLVRLLGELGAGIHANTPGDAFAALSAGIPASHIVYSGTNLDREDMQFLVERGIPLNLDSLDQLRAFAGLPGRSDHVGLRYLIDDEERANRIGITREELPDALEVAARADIAVRGLHMYAGTNTRRAERFLECLDRLIEASRKLPDLSFVDIGGGFGISYDDDAPALDVETLGREVSHRVAALAAEKGPIQLVAEPGRILVGAAGSLLVTVVSVKERGGRRYVGVDSTVGNVVVPSVYHARHRLRAVTHRGADLEIPTDVCGNTTHSRDFLGRNVKLPPVRPGDRLLLADVGAYGYAMSSHFLNRPRPPEVVLDGGVAHLTTRRETFADLLATQVTS
jgi:diaminopimelate decarboxylase